ncbi:MAG: response regulator [Crocinitomicaceae bacterium]|nr:response regulator [Crocinitomicaceae bacterium]
MNSINDKISDILIIDDDKFSIMFCEFMLRVTMNYNGEINSRLSGYLGIEYLKKAALDEDKGLPDIILLDINMPGMNGFEFVKAFQEIISYFKKEICIYMLTSSLSLVDKNTADEFKEIKGFLYKPLDDIALMHLVNKLNV